MDKSSQSSGGGDSSAVTTTSGGGSSSSSSNRDVYLKQLNKISHKISKPIRRPSPVIEPQQQQNQNHPNLNHQVQTSQSQPLNQNQNQNLQHQQQQQQQHQPPVYNINKSDFRDVVQRLTGSPAHHERERERFSSPAPPPVPPMQQQPKPQSSRLHRIRPPPLAQISNRPPNLLNCAPPQPHPTNPISAVSSGGFLGGQRQPLSPLPPFPSVHAAAESPISAYMRFLQNSVASTDADLKKFQPPLSPLAPRWNILAPPPQPLQQQNVPPPPFPPPPHHQQQQNVPPPPTTSSAAYPQFPALPPSPLPFGCLPSPGLLSPSLLFSPTGQLGFQQLPLSPTVPVPSPKWNGM